MPSVNGDLTKWLRQYLLNLQLHLYENWSLEPLVLATVDRHLGHIPNVIYRFFVWICSCRIFVPLDVTNLAAKALLKTLIFMCKKMIRYAPKQTVTSVKPWEVKNQKVKILTNGGEGNAKWWEDSETGLKICPRGAGGGGGIKLPRLCLPRYLRNAERWPRQFLHSFKGTSSRHLCKIFLT